MATDRRWKKLSQPEVYIADTTCLGRSRRDRLAANLSPAEQIRANAFVRSEDAGTYRLAHGLLREVLADITGVSARHIHFHAAPHGKPHMVLAAGRSVPSFSLSHSGTSIAIVVTPSPFCGIDIEDTRRFTGDCVQLGRRCFSRAEQGLIETAPPHQRAQAFLALWVQKEAVLKATGLGLSGLGAAHLPRPGLPSGRVPLCRRDTIGGIEMLRVTRRLSHSRLLSVALPATARMPRFTELDG